MAKTKTRTKSNKSTSDKKTGAKASRAATLKTTSGATKKTSSKAPAAVCKKPSEEITIDRRTNEDRRKQDRRTKQVPVAVERRKLERRVKVNRRRQIDPTTCERDYTGEELEFMGALDEYKRTSGRMFPTCSEILEVFRKLGYEKRPAASSAETASGEPQTEALSSIVATPVSGEHVSPVHEALVL